MSESNKKILVSGCGISWGRQLHKTWVNILRSVGADIVDVGGPAVSNQWILNKTFVELLNQEFDHVVIQLTSIGKLDVEVDVERERELVKNDHIRNFTIDGVWPSSRSSDHPSKALYNQWLSSPRLETEDLFCKLILLHDWCQHRSIDLTVVAGYNIPWTDHHKKFINEFVSGTPLYTQYQESIWYKLHDHLNYNTVPNIQFQLHLAEVLAQKTCPDLVPRIQKLQQHYWVDQ